MKLDRELQLRILNALADKYPEAAFDILKEIEASRAEGVANLVYLTEHKLVEAKFASFNGLPLDVSQRQRITAAGMDFLADDGGVSAILGTVTIKFHEESLKQLIELRLTEAQLPTEEKHRLLQSVRELPADSIKHLTTRLLDLGMDNLPRAIELIRTALS
ncbi:hypothetical protein [Stutzerimonas balearica]|uniref:hypothetical protein n=1 Tax=Stutzerimonas balearica TaxID=74829 RepID=UPI00190B0244|nr:hypothetical protein [Stutzerimonas balearica]MBK3748702.1 hypothetical protein [Stutzerimonas balearica]MBK3826899.1 hypothetical protein [Stutzerimonas balearica]MBK3856589.1 hypothetical protein [Stutzerimonas balearica]